MEITNVKIKDHKYYNAIVDGKTIEFSYDGQRIRGIWYYGKNAMTEDTINWSIKAHNIAAKIIGISPRFSLTYIEDSKRALHYKANIEYLQDQLKNLKGMIEVLQKDVNNGLSVS